MPDEKGGLEAALAAEWDRETLAVYADHLQAAGDPRGELIALDLELASRSTPEMVVRRASLLSGWLGRLVPSDPHTPWIGDSFRFGFVDDLVLDDTDPNAAENLAAMLGSPLAPYLKRVTIRGEPDHVASVMRQLSRVQHVWLGELAVSCVGTVDDDAVAALIAAAPRLQLLDVSGDDVLAAFPHPGVTRLRVSGGNALPAMFDDAAFPNVGALDLALQAVPSGERYQPPWTGALAPIRLPALRRLDLSRIVPEMMTANDLEYDEDYDEQGEPTPGPSSLVVLASQAVRSRLTHVTLHSLRSRNEFDVLDALVADMPLLEQVEIAHSHYFHPPELTNTRVRLVRAAAWPWPRADEILQGDSLHVLAPGSRSGDVVPIADAAAVMERKFEDLDADARYAWTRFWVFVAELGALPWKSDPHRTWTDDRTFPAELLISAIEACPVGGSGGWRELRDELRFRRPLPVGAVVTVHRVRTTDET